MAKFKVIEVIDGDTIKVSPNFQYVNQNQQSVTDSTLRIFGYILPNKETYGYSYAKQKLESLILNKMVVLKNAQIIIENNKTWTACEVLIDNIDVSYYFPEYRA